MIGCDKAGKNGVRYVCEVSVSMCDAMFCGVAQRSLDTVSLFISVTWIIALGRGQNWPWVLGTLFYKVGKFERWENWSHKTQVFHFFVYFLFAIIQFSYHKNYSLGEKILERPWLRLSAAPPPPDLRQYLCCQTLIVKGLARVCMFVI
jgi:hypothetical protein